MTEDEWQAFAMREAGKEIGQWLEGRGRLGEPVAGLTLADLQAMAACAISRFCVLASQRMRENSADSEDPIQSLLG